MKLVQISTVLLAMATTFAQEPDPTKVNKRDRNPQTVTATPSESDNTKVNKRDRDPQAVTPTHQSNNKVDLDLTRKIRREITQNKSMSTYARNVKIVAQDGAVTLRGPVKSAEEKESIEATAKRIAGDSKVTSYLEIAPINSNTPHNK